MKPIAHRDFVRLMKGFGFTGPFSGGKHPYLTRDNFDLTIPNPHKKEIGGELLRRILRQARIDPEEWKKLRQQ
jgi:predicted RNA binding protein YcfA (HicA-like mRNA interferase family)